MFVKIEDTNFLEMLNEIIFSLENKVGIEGLMHSLTCMAKGKVARPQDVIWLKMFLDDELDALSKRSKTSVQKKQYRMYFYMKQYIDSLYLSEQIF
jgi:hypothetical protein